VKPNTEFFLSVGKKSMHALMGSIPTLILIGLLPLTRFHSSVDGDPAGYLNSHPFPLFRESSHSEINPLLWLYDRANPNPRDPHRYVDAATIPYVVLHPKALNHARLGDFATVVNLQNGRISGAIVADESAPNLPVGEGSIPLLKL
jgi:hypothetical protein